MTVSSRIAETQTDSSTTVTSKIKFARQDDSLPYRLVGSHEYGMATNFLGKLAEVSTPEQIKVYDKWIAMNPEYSFYSGIVSNLGSKPNLQSMDSATRAEFEDAYQRKSLAWMMALARVELGATMSMYGESDDPFGAVVSAVPGGKFGAKELLQILVDDLASHLKAAELDPSYQRALVPKTKLDDQTLAYLRRTRLIDDMLTKITSSGQQELIAVTAPYARQAQKYVNLLVAKVEIGTGTHTTYSGQTTTGAVETGKVEAARFIDRQNLRSCQRTLERRLPAPRPIASPLK